MALREVVLVSSHHPNLPVLHLSYSKDQGIDNSNDSQNSHRFENQVSSSRVASWLSNQYGDRSSPSAAPRLNTQPSSSGIPKIDQNRLPTILEE